MCPGIRVGRTTIGLGSSLLPYWTQQIIDSLFLFYGEVSKISAGQLNNQVTGSSDFITIGGSVGSYTFQCPNNATYKTADSDYIWFNKNQVLRTVTEDELVGYDLQRTPIKYDDNTPYSIRIIGILKSTVTLSGTDRDKLFSAFFLPILWDNSLNLNGHIKGNRLGQTLWTPIKTLYDTFTDTDAVHLADHTMNVGAGWTAADTWTISSNKLAQGATGAQWYYAVTESGQTDIDVSAEMVMPAVANYSSGITFRYQDDTHKWLLKFERDGSGTPYIRLYLDTTAKTGAINFTQVNGGTKTVRVTTVGNVITVYLDGISVGTVTDATYNDKTKVGIAAFGNASSYIFAPTDNFILY